MEGRENEADVLGGKSNDCMSNVYMVMFSRRPLEVRAQCAAQMRCKAMASQRHVHRLASLRPMLFVRSVPGLKVFDGTPRSCTRCRLQGEETLR